jgi:hypothetical protein
VVGVAIIYSITSVILLAVIGSYIWDVFARRRAVTMEKDDVVVVGEGSLPTNWGLSEEEEGEEAVGNYMENNAEMNSSMSLSDWAIDISENVSTPIESAILSNHSWSFSLSDEEKLDLSEDEMYDTEVQILSWPNHSIRPPEITDESHAFEHSSYSDEF